jgi:hypothetical protein
MQRFGKHNVGLRQHVAAGAREPQTEGCNQVEPVGALEHDNGLLARIVVAENRDRPDESQ